MQNGMGKEYDKLRTCQQKTANKSPKTEKCQIRTKYNCRNKNVNKNLNQTTQQKTDRGTIQGRGTRDTPDNIYKDRITYNHELAKWICNICGKQYAPQSQQNAIQHACKHYRQSKREIAPEIKWAPKTQEEIYTLRRTRS